MAEYMTHSNKSAYMNWMNRLGIGWHNDGSSNMFLPRRDRIYGLGEDPFEISWIIQILQKHYLDYSILLIPWVVSLCGGVISAA